jgi:hypothetical protein
MNCLPKSICCTFILAEFNSFLKANFIKNGRESYSIAFLLMGMVMHRQPPPPRASSEPSMVMTHFP